MTTNLRHYSNPTIVFGGKEKSIGKRGGNQKWRQQSRKNGKTRSLLASGLTTTVATEVRYRNAITPVSAPAGTRTVRFHAEHRRASGL